MLPSYEELEDYEEFDEEPDFGHADNRDDSDDDYDIAHSDPEHGHLQTVWESLVEADMQDEESMAGSLADHFRKALDSEIDAWVDQHDVAMTFREIRAAVDGALAELLSDRDVAFDLASHIYKKLA